MPAAGGPEAVEEYLSALPAKRATMARDLASVFADVTGFQPHLWGKVIGYGRYEYTYRSGRSGEWFATGFAPQASKFALHIMPGYAPFQEIADRLGPHKRGASCWYITRPDAVDDTALRDLIRAGLADLAEQWPVLPA